MGTGWMQKDLASTPLPCKISKLFTYSPLPPPPISSPPPPPFPPLLSPPPPPPTCWSHNLDSLPALSPLLISPPPPPFTLYIFTKLTVLGTVTCSQDTHSDLYSQSWLSWAFWLVSQCLHPGTLQSHCHLCHRWKTLLVLELKQTVLVFEHSKYL